LFALLLAGPSAATTFTYLVYGGQLGLDDGHACLSTETSGQCAAQAKFAIGPSDSFPITGSFSYDDATNTIDIDITLAVGSMPGSYDGVTSVEFTTVHYVVNDMPVLLAAGNSLYGGAASGDVSGSYAQKNGATTVVGPDAFGPIAADFTSFSCSNLNAVGQCGLIVGASRDFNLNVGTTGSGDPFDFVHTFNFNVVIPEPATGSLLALGLVTLAFARRRH
jgi:hypothetical protein